MGVMNEFKNVDCIIDMINKTLDSLESELEDLKESLPQNCTFLK
jgi:hypothetical protein